MRSPYGSEYLEGHYVELLKSGEDYFAACERIIDSAKRYIHFQTYIVDSDSTGRRFVDALIRAAGRGVKVYFLLDAYGGKSFSATMAEELMQAGILFRKFSPAFITKGLQFSLRLHHKVLIADGEVAVIGGMNVANRYHGYPGFTEWLDFALLVKGPGCAHALSIVKKLWNKTFIGRKERAREAIHGSAYFDGGPRIRILQNNWYRNKIEILRSYRYAFRHSQKRMILMASYFLPGRNERRLLRDAGRRGVDIKIVLASKSDAPVLKRATYFLYDFILRNNISIYEYLPSNMHAKVATVDGSWTTVGSYNMNHLSDYGSIEMNVGVLDEKFTESVENKLLEIIEKDCRQVTFAEYKRRKTWLFQLTDWFAYQVIRVLMRLMFLLTSRTKQVQR